MLNGKVHSLGRALKAYRIGLGINAEEVGRRLGLTQTATVKLEAGITVPSTPTLARCAELLHWTDEDIGRFVRECRDRKHSGPVRGRAQNQIQQVK